MRGLPKDISKLVEILSDVILLQRSLKLHGNDLLKSNDKPRMMGEEGGLLTHSLPSFPEILQKQGLRPLISETL